MKYKYIVTSGIAQMFEELILQDAGYGHFACRKLFFFYDYCSTTNLANRWEIVTDASLIIAVAAAGFGVFAFIRRRRERQKTTV